MTQTPVLLLHEDPSLLVAVHMFHIEPYYTDRLRALVLREDLKSTCPFSSCSSLFPKMTGKSTEFSRTHILRDALRFSVEQAHWVNNKEKLDDVLFFHSSFLRDILQGQARPEKYVLVPNDITEIPTYAELRRPIYEAQPFPSKGEGTPRERPNGAQVRMSHEQQQNSQGQQRLLHRSQVL